MPLKKTVRLGCIRRPSVSLAILALSISPAIAQESAPALQSEGKDTSARMEHVLVLGEKILRPYLETFSSVGIVTAEELQDYDIADTSDAYKRLANVRAFSQGAGSKSIEIRGLNADGVTQPTNSTALISMVVDGVTQSAEGLKRGSRGLWDVAQLEVYRGPQSTIQGRSALGGTVVIKTQDPTFEPEYKFRALYGELDREEAAGVISAPIIEDELAFRISGEYAEKTSDIHFTDKANKRFAKDKYHNVRGKLLYTPASLDALRVLVTASDVYDSPSSSPVSGPDFYDRVFDRDSVFAEGREMDLQNYNVDIAWDMGDGVILRSTSGYNDTDLKISSVPSSEDYFRDDHRKDGDFMQEFRFEMNEEIAGFTGVAGLFYGSFEQKADSNIRYIQNGTPYFVQLGKFDNTTDTWAVYADLRYRLTGPFSLIIGGRYQDDSVRNSGEVELVPAGGSAYDLDSDFNVFLPKAGLALDLTDTQTLAFTASKGYRQGFAQTLVGTNEINDVDPEYVWSYEIAYRISALQSKLLLGANLFYNDYTDQQVAVTDPEFAPLANTLNAGDSESWGAELEAQYALGNGLSLYGAVGVLKTKLGDFPADVCDGGCDGNQYSEAPEVTASLGGDYRHSSGFFASIATSYTGEFYRTIINSADTEVDSSFVVDVKLGYDFGHFRVSTYVNNVLDENYLTGINSENSAYAGDARAMGVEVLAQF
ncbi:Ferric-pseudobactin BN7/BN8 receptor [Halioglobus japonicus]|nr:Ferric-pseudobactin BN7/BN8 receptor [Halioglobus japonicus]